MVSQDQLQTWPSPTNGVPPPLDVLAFKAHVILADNGVTKQTPLIRLVHGHSFIVSIAAGVTLLSLMKL